MSAEPFTADVQAEKVADAIAALPPQPTRRLVALAGPPGAGKSTVAARALSALHRRGLSVGLVQMDGFHYDNAILTARGMLDRKGSPETFDIAGLHALLRRLLVEDEIAVPEFDRTLDKAIAARSVIATDQRIVLVEGNYLLLDEPGWAELRRYWVMSVFLNVPQKTLEKRLIKRWLTHDLPPDRARERALANDIPNALRVVQNSVSGDLILD